MTATRYATICSGLEVPSLAWKHLDWEPVFFAENATFPSNFLRHRYPKVPNLGDLLTIKGARHRGKVDVLWASFPCQDWSEAGGRKGVGGKTGYLTLAGVNLVDEIDPKVFCFENVHGILTHPSNAWGLFLGRIAGEDFPLLPPGGRWSNAGYVRGTRRAVAWRTLDAQRFGLPQQRVRVFLVACPLDGADPRDILFERTTDADTPFERPAGGTEPVEGTIGSPDPAWRIAIRGRTIKGFYGQQIEQGDEVSNCLRASQGGGDKAYVLCRDEDRYRVRLLTPLECERLQGMDDDYSLIPGATEGARYHAIGNSLPVPVVRWIGERIDRVMKNGTV